MSFFDKISVNMTNAGRTISQKARNSSDAGNLTREQNKEKKNEQAMIAELGRLYYERHKDDPDAAFAEQIASIKSCRKRITDLDEEIRQVRSREPELVDLPEEPKQPAGTPTAMVCMQCGATYTNGSTNCAACGAKLVAQYASRGRSDSAEQGQSVSEKQELPNKNQYSRRSAAAQQPTAQAKPQAKISLFCPYCGLKAAPGQAYCRQCGKKID